MANEENVDATASDDKPRIFGEIAHLIPASPFQASLYVHVARWVFGIPYDRPNVSDHFLQKLIHGAAPVDDNGKILRRLQHTGAKHMVSNKLRLCNQGDYYDREAKCLIVPVCTLDEGKAWNGNGYKAIVMVDSKGGELSRMQ